MLVLSRVKGESIEIGHDITVVVVEVRGDKVRIGVQAPKDVSVHRTEVYKAIKRSGEDRLSKREPFAAIKMTEISLPGHTNPVAVFHKGKWKRASWVRGRFIDSTRIELSGVVAWHELG